MSARIRTVIFVILSVSLIVSLILSLIMTARNTGYWILAGILLALFAFFYWAGKKSHKLTGLMLLLIVVNGFIIVPELFLRIIDFHYESGIANQTELQFGGLRPEHYMHFVQDENLFWKLPSSHAHVNSLGFPGEEIVTPKPPHIFRILFLGDSVTQLGFAQYIQMYLNRYPANDTLQFDCVTLAVSGYSSYQGKVMAQLYGRRLEADLVFVMFGWNDHWLAYRKRDELFKTSRSMNMVWQIYHYSRILQLANKAVHATVPEKNDRLINEVRVLPAEYEHNLLEIDSSFEQQHISVVFMTAPTSHYKLGVPDFLIREKFALSADSVITLHKEYNEIARTVAHTRQIALLDLEAEFDTLPNLPELFVQDGIHFTRLGSEFAAQRIYDFIESRYLELPHESAAK